MIRAFAPFRILPAIALAAVVALGSLAAHAADKQGVVIQVSDADAKIWNLALNVAANVQNDIGKDNINVEIVAFGPGLGMLKFDSEVSNRLAKAHKEGVVFQACGNTMTKTKVSEKDLAPGVKIVPAGVIEIMSKQRQGWSYIKL